MTKQELIQYITDRVDTNNSFEVSAKDVQEAIVQVVNELYDPAFSGASSLQDILEVGNTADTDTIQGIILQSAVEGITNTLNSSGINVSQTGSESINLTVSKDSPYSYERVLNDGSSFKKEFNGFEDKVDIVNNGSLSYECEYRESYAPSGDFKLIKNSNNSIEYTRKHDAFQFYYKGLAFINGENSYELNLEPDSMAIRGRLESSSRYYDFSYDSSNNGFSINTDPLSSFSTLATLGVNGSIQAKLIEEETSTPEYALVPDANGVIKKYPFPEKELEFGQFLLEGGGVLELNKFYSSVNVNINSLGNITIKLPNPLTEEHIGDWFFVNTNRDGGQGNGMTIVSEDANGFYNSGLIPENGSLTLKVVRLKTGTNDFLSKFVEIQKDTV